MKQLLAALGSDIKPQGMDKWVARCPVHKDKDFAMSIKLDDMGCVLACCHACGANGLDLYKSLNLALDELFGGKKYTQIIPREVEEQYKQDKLVIELYKSDRDAGKTATLADKRRYKLAVARSEGIKAKFNSI